MLTELLQNAIRASGVRCSAISRRTGISQATLSRFLRGQLSLTLGTAEKVLDALGLEVVIRPRRSTRKGE
ncbi:MAG TPA: helix-turn-helix transcriptional regulator [Isosphaeraceae bacterium]|nr:helix-turn-helix transcriptional regulator [Isosphaeraceae bacterium]